MMNAATRNRCPGSDTFIICFYCNETFRTLSSLSKHCCSAEQKISLDFEPLEIVSDTNSNDLDEEDSVISTETSSEKPSDTPGQEITETESSVSNVGETSFSGTETVCEKAFSEAKSNTKRHEITELAADASEKRLSEHNSVVVRKATELDTDASEKQSSEASSDVREVTEASKKQSSEGSSDVREFTEASKKQSPVVVSDTGQKITEVEPNADEEFNRASPDLVSKVLQYYEKQTKPGTPDSCCKSPSTEVEFQSSRSPLPIVEPGSPKLNDTQIECSATDNCNKGLSSETKCDTYGKNIIQKESDTLKHDARGLECQAYDLCSTPLPKIESVSSNMFSRSSSVEMDSDSLGCGDDQADSDDSETSNILLSEKKSDLLKHDHIQVESHASETSVNSLSEENVNITKHNSNIVKPCYVKVQDIFKSLVDAKVSPQKIFSWKKKYHICDVCNKIFRMRSDLNIHYLIHTTLKPFVCSICNKSFIKQCNLFAHHLSHTIKRHHACSVCKKTFPKKSLLLRHRLTHTKEKPYPCEKCDKSYSSKSSLNEHYLTHSDERPFICEICNATFSNKRYLRKHYYSHQNKKKDLVCEFCFKTFKRKHHLKEHYNIHTNDRPHECKICNKSFHLRLTLYNHYTVAHRNERALIFPEIVKTSADCKVEKNPVIQKIEISAEVHKCEKTPVVEKPSVIRISKDTLSYSTRRKSFIPKKYLQPD